MLWFYTRNQQSLTLETRYDNATHEYVAVLTGLAGEPVTKRFTSSEAFQEWIVTLESELAAGKWTADGPPHILPDGWRDKPWSL
jgi:hypothetical protein